MEKAFLISTPEGEKWGKIVGKIKDNPLYKLQDSAFLDPQLQRKAIPSRYRGRSGLFLGEKGEERKSERTLLLQTLFEESGDAGFLLGKAEASSLKSKDALALKKALDLAWEPKKVQVGGRPSEVLTELTRLFSSVPEGKKLSEDISLIPHGEDLYFSRKREQAFSHISPSEAPDLKILRWQYGIPLDYHSLRPLFQAKNETIETELETLLKGDQILGLQVEPAYLLWYTARILLAAYSSKQLGTALKRVRIRPSKKDNLPNLLLYLSHGHSDLPLLQSKLLRFLPSKTGLLKTRPSKIFSRMSGGPFWYTSGLINFSS